MAAGNQWKHLGFTLALSKRLLSLLNLKTIALALLSTYWLLGTKKHKANRYFVYITCYQETIPMSSCTHCERNEFYFENKAIYRAEDRPTDVCLKMTFS